MSGLNFADFFTDVHGYSPLPWQERLARQLIENHAWPDLIDLPTASGKTACIDIALFHLAWCARRREPWHAARRIVFVVDRRIIVDAAAERAEVLRAKLAHPRTESIRQVADALSSLGGTHPLACLKLRGGMPRERGIATNPAQPMIISSTVDQVGSRLLFRGYGLSPYSYPVHAGLLGYDTLFLVDEAHLSQPLIDTVAAIRSHQQRAEQPLGMIAPLRLVPLSATANTTGNRFQLDAHDIANKHLHERRTAPKPARLIEAANKLSERVKVLLSEAVALANTIDAPAPAIAVVVNRVHTARVLHSLLSADAIADRVDIELMIGRSRPLERDEIARRVLEKVGANQSTSRERGIIVVATQTIEVGADLDFQGLVTECAALDALRQRFGRLDRLGRFRKARAVIIGGAENEDDPVYGASLSKTWSWLKDVAATSNGSQVVDFSIESMERLTQARDLVALSSPVREQLILTPVHVDLLCQTSPMPMYSPDVPALLHGLHSGAPDVQVVWRADLPLGVDGVSLDSSRWTVAAALLELVPPTSLESVSLPLSSVRAWLLRSKDVAELADIEGTPSAELEEDTKTVREVLRRVRGGWQIVSARDIQPGDVIVAPSIYGGCDKYGFAPDSELVVTDISRSARNVLKQSDMVVVTQQWLERIGVNPEVVHEIWRKLSEDWKQEIPAQQVVADFLAAVDQSLPEDLGWLASEPLIDVIENPDGSLFALVLMDGHANVGDISDEDISSSRTLPVALHDHNAGVARYARSLAQSLCLAPQHIEHLEQAAQLHDIGKADPRFQRMLRSGDTDVLPGVLLAKGLRISTGSTARYEAERHEAYSVALIEKHPSLLADAEDPDLVRYLIGTHHGRGRALMPDRNDEGTAFDIAISGRDYSFEGVPRLGSLQAGWASLFWRLNRRYGPWGLAYLESILRLADWLQSAEELEKGQPK